MKRWCIINLRHIRDAALYDAAPLGLEVLDPRWSPHCFYDDKDSAEKELLRLAHQHPNNNFVLFEAVSQATESKSYFINNGRIERVVYVDKIDQ